MLEKKKKKSCWTIKVAELVTVLHVQQDIFKGNLIMHFNVKLYQ